MIRLLLIAAILVIAAHAQTDDERLMTDADYKTFLTQTEDALPRLETALKRIDKRSGAAHSGAVGLVEIKDIRVMFLDTTHKRKRTLSDELDLCGFLQRLYINASIYGIYAPELSDLIFRLNDDIVARVASHKDP